MKVLVINAGSSSLKYQLIDMATTDVIAKGNCERVGIDGLFSAFEKKEVLMIDAPKSEPITIIRTNSTQTKYF